jgi:hypothetical protein
MAEPDKNNTATNVEIIEIDGSDHTGTALHDASGQVWLTFARPWWDVASWLWWWLVPGPRRWVVLRKASGGKVRIRACRIATKLVRIST